jgi:tight adherence protein B
MITNALRAGHSLQSALSLVSLEFKDPIGTEFSQLTNDINLGIPMKDALERMANTMESVTDLRLFTTAVMINREAGGNLAEVLEKLGYTIRDRFKFKGHLKAITGQSRLTGYVIGLMPLFLGLIFSVISPGYTDPLFDTVLGLILLVAAIGMEILGMFIIGKIVNIRY